MEKVIIAIEKTQTALKKIKQLRLSVNQLFESLANGLQADHGEENKEKKYLDELQKLLDTVAVGLRDFEQTINSLNFPDQFFNLEAIPNLTVEPAPSHQGLYRSLIGTFKWNNRVNLCAEFTRNIFGKNNLRRSYYKLYKTSDVLYQNVRSHDVLHSWKPAKVDKLIQSFRQMYSNMTFTASRPLDAPNVILEITLERVLKVVVALRIVKIEKIVVKGYNESMDLWTESRYKVFQKITESAYIATMCYDSVRRPEVQLQLFVYWLYNFRSLFSTPCKKCGFYLRNTFPPIWRDTHNLEPYHEECKY